MYVPCKSDACSHLSASADRSEIVDIANFIYENPSNLDLSLQGIWVSDRESSIF